MKSGGRLMGSGRNRVTLLKAGLFGAAILFNLSHVSAQELPPLSELQGNVSAALPGYWQVSEMRIVATSDLGDAAQPRRVVRFEADAVPKAPLFAQSSVEGPYILVVPTTDVKDTRTLYGTLDLTYRAGKWTGPAEIENPVAGLGQPLSLFSGPTLELGSEAAEARLAALRDQSVDAFAAALERELAEKKAAHAKTLAEQSAADAKALDDMRRTREKMLAEAQEKANAALAAQEARYREELARLTSDNAPLIAEAKAERERLLADERAATTAALRTLQDEAAAELDRLRGEHATARGTLIAQQTQELAEIETGLAIHRRSLERQLEDAQEVIALQQQLTAALEARDLGAVPLFEAFEAVRRQKTDFLARVPKEWRGTMDCRDTGGKGIFESSRIVGLELTSVLPEGFGAQFDRSNARWAEFMIADGGFAFPLGFRVTMEKDEEFEANQFEVRIEQDGQLVGDLVKNWTIDGVTVNVTCRLRMSS